MSNRHIVENISHISNIVDRHRLQYVLIGRKEYQELQESYLWNHPKGFQFIFRGVSFVVDMEQESCLKGVIEL
jgi:hypothetical protein